MTRPRLRSRLTLLSAAALIATAVSVSTAPAAAATSGGPVATAARTGLHGMTPRHGGSGRAAAGSRTPAAAAETRVCQGCSPPLLPGDRSVMGTSSLAGDNSQYAIYWTGAGAIPSSYQATINQYLTDVAADSGRTTNVYATDAQYTGAPGYSSHFAGALTDANALPPNGCTPEAGYSRCVSDAQLEQEILDVINARNLAHNVDLAHMFVMFLPPGVDLCTDQASATCAGNVFCGYHSGFSVTSGPTVLYAAMPYATLQGCASGQQPNGDPYADGEIDTLSHEVNETVTDPLGTSWQDSKGNEDGDECSNIYGSPFGTQADTTNSTQYNQVINGHRYYTQEEFSNDAYNTTGAGCVQAVRLVTVVPARPRIPNDGSSTTAVNVTVLQSPSGPGVGGDQVDVALSSASGSCGSITPTTATTNSAGVATITYTASTANDALCVITAGEVAGGQIGKGSIVQGGETYHALTPFRLADTRGGCSTCAVNGPHLSAGGSIAIPVRGPDGVPADATAAVLNITATGGTASSFFTAYGNAPRPTASNLNFVAGQTVANLATVPLDSSGHVNVYNLAGTVDLVVDLEGYMEPVPGPFGLFNSLTPARIADTRPGSGQAHSGQTLGGGMALQVKVTGAGGVPSSGVAAVAINLTAVLPTAAGYLTAFPDDAAKPNASNVNFAAGQVVPNRVVVRVPAASGSIFIYNYTGNTDVVVDVVGWFADGSGSTGALFTPLTPTRVADTRPGSGGSLEGQTVGPTAIGIVPVSDPLSLPGDATAVVGNVTVVDTSAASYLTVYPANASRPTASDLNWVAGQVVPNEVIAAIGTGLLAVYNNTGTTDVVVDISGFWS